MYLPLFPLMAVIQIAPHSFEHSIRDMIVNATPTAKFVLLLLLFFSVLTWAVIIDKFRLFRAVHGENEHFLAMFRGKIGEFEQIYRNASRFMHSPLAIVFRTGYRQLLAERENRRTSSVEDSSGLSPGARERIKVVIEQSARLELNILERFLTFLATAGSVSPFVGLFGTVWGIMNSFRGLGMQGSASIGAVAPGIAEALIATAAGLAAAIPAVIAYNHFQKKLIEVAETLEEFNKEFMGRLIP